MGFTVVESEMLHCISRDVGLKSVRAWGVRTGDGPAGGLQHDGDSEGRRGDGAGAGTAPRDQLRAAEMGPGAAAAPQGGRVPDTRQPRGRAQEARPRQGAQGLPVGQALSPRHSGHSVS